MSEARKGAEHVRRAAEREHADHATHDDRRKSDSESATAHPALTDPKLKKGRPKSNDWRDKPVDEVRDKDIKHGGLEGAALKRGRR